MKNLIKSALAFLLLTAGAISCKKSETDLTASNQLQQEGLKERSKTCRTYYSYLSSGKTSKLTEYNSNTGKNLDLFTFKYPNQSPLFHSHRGAGENNALWGIQTWNDLYGWEPVFKFDLNTKTADIKKFFPNGSEDITRQIVRVDEIDQRIYYLEGKTGGFAFTKLVRCDYNGNGKETITLPYMDNTIVAAVIGNGILYYVNTDNALIKFNMKDKSLVTLIESFNLAGASIVDKIQLYAVKKSGVKYHEVKMKKVPIDERRTCLFTIDFKNGRVFWLSNPKSTLIPANTVGNLYDKIRPCLMTASIAGTREREVVPNVKFFNGDKAPQTNSNRQFTLQRGNMEIDPLSQKLYIGLEVLECNPTNSHLNGFYDYAYLKTNLSMWHCDYEGNNIKYFIEPEKTGFNNPKGWNTLKTYFKDLPNQQIPADHKIYRGSLESFVITQDNDHNY